MIGRTISHYRVTGALGAGGMGEVYRATDTSLGREVAIKVLPSDVGRDPERLARFRREPVPWLATPAAEAHARFSPDGRWIAFDSEESGRSEVYIQAFRGAERIQVSTEGGSHPAWSPGGDRVYCRQGNALLAAEVAARGRLAASPPRRLFESGWDLAGLESTAASFAVTRDGERFLMIRAEPASIPTHIDLVLNWFEELVRVAPN